MLKMILYYIVLWTFALI